MILTKGDQHLKQIPLLFSIVGLLISGLGAYCGWIFFPSMVHKKVVENVILTDGSEQYKRFIELPQPLTFKVYIFNVTNSELIQRGSLPIVQEVGPYIYKQYRKKRVRHFSRDGSKITFAQDQLYVFDAEASAPLQESDQIVALNMHMNAFLQIFEREITDILQGFANRINYRLDRTPGVRILKRLMDRIRGKRKSVLDIDENDPSLAILLMHLNANMNAIFDNPKSMFLTTTVRQYLFDGVRFCIAPQGLARAICNQIKESGSKTIRELSDGSLAFSFLHHKNGTGQEIYEVHTGKGDVMRVLEIQKVDDSQNLHVWLNVSSNSANVISMCNHINGTDASMFPPFRQHGDSMYIFSSDICRSVQLFFQSEIQYHGIPGYRYSIGENFINDIGPEYDNDCFCVDKLTNVIKRRNGCLYAGALDLTTCLDAPIILTLPHMLGAANEYRRTVRGLHPDAKKHQTFVDVQHLTGIPLQGGKRVQFNMFLKSINRIKITENLVTVLMPVIWIEEGIQLNEESIALIKKQLINTLHLLHIIHWSALISGLILTAASLIYYGIKICNIRKKL